MKSNAGDMTWKITYYDEDKAKRLEASHTKLLEALEHAVSIYGRFGAVVNEPSNPGEWIEKAKTAITNAKDLNQP